MDTAKKHETKTTLQKKLLTNERKKLHSLINSHIGSSQKKLYLLNKQVQNYKKEIGLRAISQRDGDIDTDLLNNQIESLMQ